MGFDLRVQHFYFIAMSVHGEESQYEGLSEHVESLQAELSRLNRQLKYEIDEAEIDKLKTLIDDINAKIHIQKVSVTEPTLRVEPRKSSRERKLTPKMVQLMSELKQQETSQKEKKFIMLYDKWKEQIRATRSSLKNECFDKDLCCMMDDVEGLEAQVKVAYENVRGQSAPSSDIRRKMDSCTAVTADVMGLLKVRMNEVGQDDFDANAENARLHIMLDREYAQSIFSASVPNSSICSRQSKCPSEQQSITVKRADCAAQLAAKRAEMELEEAIAAQRQELKRLEDQRDLQVIAAKMKAYSEAGSDEVPGLGVSHCPPVFNKNEENKEEPSHQNNEQSNNVSKDISLVHAVYDMMTLTRLPAPEPSVFSGDPLQFIEWSTSFKALIERRCTNPADRLFYLQKYINGEARSVLEGSFYRKDEEAYNQAWEALNARYGHPFVIQRAYRERLNNWPKISSKDSVRLRQYSDFLTACSNAMPHIKGLQVLNDCEENQRMLQKLPDWVTSRWNRRVTKQLQETHEYPSFKEFAKFLAHEADVACNPVTSLYALKSYEERPSRDMKRPKANVFITNTKESEKSNTVMRTQGAVETFTRETNESKRVNTPFSSLSPVKCMYCSESHFIHKCQTFTNKSPEEKKRFILDKNLCFGCLKKGHNSKDCRKKATCDVCKKRHPTPLHEHRNASPDTSPHAVAQAEEKSSSLSCSIDKGDGGSTSMIVPVWLSSVRIPETETLVYALLDTQSSTTFVDQEVCKKMGAGLEPVKLKLTTIMGKDSIVQSDRVSGLRVRGFSSHSFVNLPPAYTRDFIPLERTHIPTPATAKRWKHLSSIAPEIPELLDCEVGLLIGYDCSRALAPRHVITGGDEGHMPLGLT